MPTLTLPAFTFEDGRTVAEAPVAYATWGRLNEAADNALVVCHALTGDPRADAWWGPLIGPGRAFDTDRFFVVCLGVIGSPYGTLSPLTRNPATGEPYGMDLPQATIRDTVRLHRQALEALGVRGVALVAGGSMGGMQVLEWGFEGDFVRAMLPLAVGGRHSAWCVAWSEAQRQAIFADARWREGRYPPGDPPAAGLAAARMMAMVSYRSRGSFEARFGRDRAGGDAFAVEGYLRYQGEKLVRRFDAACYVHLTRQMDTHDVARGRGRYEAALARLTQPTLVVGFDTDVLYPVAEQQELAALMPRASLAVVETLHGHDAFLIEFDHLDALIRPWMIEHVSLTRPEATWS